MTSKTQTRKPSTQATTSITDLQAQIKALTELVSGLLVAIPVPNTQPKANGKKAHKVDAKKQAIRDEKKARYAAINERKQVWIDTYTLEDAVKLAVAEIRKNKKAGFINAKVQGTSPDSLRVYLTSDTNQSLRAVRIESEVRYADCETMLESAIKGK